MIFVVIVETIPVTFVVDLHILSMFCCAFHVLLANFFPQILKIIRFTSPHSQISFWWEYEPGIRMEFFSSWDLIVYDGGIDDVGNIQTVRWQWRYRVPVLRFAVSSSSIKLFFARTFSFRKMICFSSLNFVIVSSFLFSYDNECQASTLFHTCVRVQIHHKLANSNDLIFKKKTNRNLISVGSPKRIHI